MASVVCRGRGRPRSKKREDDEASRSRFNSATCTALPGVYSDLWWAISSGQRSGFEKYAMEWCSSVCVKNGVSVHELCGNPLYLLVDRICAAQNPKWYRATERQFMFQAADVVIIMHVILSFAAQSRCGGMSLQYIKRILGSKTQFVKWAANNTDNTMGDVLAAGDGAVINFRRVMQDGVLFHARHCHGCQKLNKTHEQLDCDLYTFSQTKQWLEKHEVNITVHGDNIHYECGGVCAALTGACDMWPTGATDTNLMSLAHVVSCALDPMARGKVVKHIVGRLKTLIGHNNTIPSPLLMLQNTTLTHDQRKRGVGCGPMLWCKLAKERGENEMKMQRKRSKSALCASLNTAGGSVSDLVWGMFDANLVVNIIHGDNSTPTKHVIRHPIIELHQDAQFYDAHEQKHLMKTQMMQQDHTELVKAGAKLKPLSCYDQSVMQIDSSYFEMLHDAGDRWRFRCHVTKAIGNGISMLYSHDKHIQAAMFASLSLPYTHNTKLTSSRLCNMKDPDKFGYSWCPRKKRKRISEPKAAAIDQQPVCSLCKKMMQMPVACSDAGICCMLCLWQRDIGYIHADCVIAGSTFVFNGGKKIQYPAAHMRLGPIDDHTWTAIAITGCECTSLTVEPMIQADVVREEWEHVTDLKVDPDEMFMTYTDDAGKQQRKPFQLSSTQYVDPISQQAIPFERVADITRTALVRTASYFDSALHLTNSSAYDVHGMLAAHTHFDDISVIFGCHMGSKLHLVCLACIASAQANGGDAEDMIEKWRTRQQSQPGVKDSDLIDQDLIRELLEWEDDSAV